MKQRKRKRKKRKLKAEELWIANHPYPMYIAVVARRYGKVAIGKYLGFGKDNMRFFKLFKWKGEDDAQDLLFWRKYLDARVARTKRGSSLGVILVTDFNERDRKLIKKANLTLKKFKKVRKKCRKCT